MKGLHHHLTSLQFAPSFFPSQTLVPCNMLHPKLRSLSENTTYRSSLYSVPSSSRQPVPFRVHLGRPCLGALDPK